MEPAGHISTDRAVQPADKGGDKHRRIGDSAAVGTGHLTDDSAEVGIELCREPTRRGNRNHEQTGSKRNCPQSASKGMRHMGHNQFQ